MKRLLNYERNNEPTDEQIGYILRVANEVSAERYEKALSDIMYLNSREQAEQYISEIENELKQFKPNKAA